MSRIRLLPEQVANQIAAGEVVERPASVVKELVENAMDAGASRIIVEIQRGGRQLIRVADDGFGMDRDDALLCLERHATSKIAAAADLASVRSMGFRGEALPSIASVSRFVLSTCPREGENLEPTQVTVMGGKLTDVRAVGHPPGTTVEVRQLFYNLPARRKFMRSEETERSHILHYLTLAALAHPEIGFTLRQEDRLVWQVPPMPSGGGLEAAVRDRMRILVGADLELVRVEGARVLPARGVDVDGGVAEEDCPAAGTARVWGFVGAPGVSRATRQDQHVFVNRRPVDNRGLNYAVLEGYHTVLMKGRYPVVCLFLELDPSEVDVNVHPAKREVRFHRERAVREAVVSVIRDGLLAYHRRTLQDESEAKACPAPEIRRGEVAGLRGRGVAGRSGEMAGKERTPGLGNHPATGAHGTGEDVPAAENKSASIAGPWILPALEAVNRVEVRVTASAAEAERGGQPLPSDPQGRERPLLRVPLRFLGVVARLYVVLESDRGMVLMDQHAAHERVLFEQMLSRLEHGDVPSQRLLLPETVELSVRDSQFVREHLTTLSRLGVGLSDFGERTFLLDGLPPFIRVRDAKQFVRDLIDALLVAGRDVNKLRLGEDMVAKTVCRHAVKANDPLRQEELEKLIEDLRACAMPYTCPHGRPTLIEISAQELERKFGRVQ